MHQPILIRNTPTYCSAGRRAEYRPIPCMCMYVCKYVPIHTLHLILRKEGREGKKKKKKRLSFPLLHSGQKVCNDYMCRQTATAFSPFFLLPSFKFPTLLPSTPTKCNVNCHDPGLPSFMHVDIGFFPPPLLSY